MGRSPRSTRRPCEWIAVERLDLPVLESENVATWSLHAPAGGRNQSIRNFEWSGVGSIQGQFHDHDVPGHIYVLKLSVHVGEGSCKDPDRNADLFAAAIGHADRFVCERSIFVEAARPSSHVLLIGNRECLADRRFVFAHCAHEYFAVRFRLADKLVLAVATRSRCSWNARPKIPGLIASVCGHLCSSAQARASRHAQVIPKEPRRARRHE
jgi:hypothetical protein